jgi:hypothetical protein
VSEQSQRKQNRDKRQKLNDKSCGAASRMSQSIHIFVEIARR